MHLECIIKNIVMHDFQPGVLWLRATKLPASLIIVKALLLFLVIMIYTEKMGVFQKSLTTEYM